MLCRVCVCVYRVRMCAYMCGCLYVASQERRRHVFTSWAYNVECDAVEAQTLALLGAIRALYVAAGVAGEAGGTLAHCHQPTVSPCFLLRVCNSKPSLVCE